jgi:sugar porter (SP) family MFS transporter
MGLLTLVEDRPTPKSVYNWRVYVCAATAAFASMMIGYDSAFIGTTLALPTFVEEFNFAALSKSQLALVQSNIVSVYQAGAFFGTLFAYVAAHYIGRQRGLSIFALVFVLGAGLMLGANSARGLGLIYAGRVLAGIGVGGASMLTPIYISEIAPPAIRGRLVGLYELGWQIGGLVGFWINYGIEQTIPKQSNNWLIPFAVQLIPAGFLLVGSFFIKESPRWLYFQGKREKALRNLCWLRQLQSTDVYLVEEVAAIDQAIEHQRATVGLGFLQPFRSAAKDGKILYRLFLGGMLFLWQNGKPCIPSLPPGLTLSRLWDQCDQLLLSDRVQEPRHHRHKHKLLDHWPFRCGEDMSHHCLASRPH